jgi:hypothetical protein
LSRYRYPGRLDQVRRLREDLWLYRTLFLHRAENLTIQEQYKLAELLAS